MEFTGIMKPAWRTYSGTYTIEDRVVRISASIGVALFPVDGDSAQELLRRADEAMYRVKSAGKRGYGDASG